MKRCVHFAIAGLLAASLNACATNSKPDPVDTLLFSTDQMYLARAGETLEFRYPKRDCDTGEVKSVSTTIGTSTVCPPAQSGGILETVFSRGADAVVSIGGLIKLFND